MKNTPALTALRTAKRKAYIHQHVAGLGFRGAPGNVVAFKTDGDDTQVLDQADFQKTVLDGTKAIAKSVEDVGNKHEALLKNFDQLDKTTKTKFEELTSIKKVVNDQQANFDAFGRKLNEIKVAMDREVTSAFGDPVAKVVRDEEMRARFNAAVRLGVSKGNGDRYQKDAKAWLERIGQQDVVKALGEDSSPGSNLIDDRLAGEIYDLIAGFGIWNTLEVVNQLTKEFKFPVDTADPTANFVLTEAGTIGDDADIAGSSVTATAEVIAILLNVSLQLLDDAEYDVTSWLMRKFARAYAKRQDYAAFRGDGTADATNGGMTGVFEFGTVVNAAAGNSTVQTTDLEDWMNCLLVTDALFERPCRWWMHPFVLSRAVLVRDSNGRPIFQTALEAPSPGAVGSILGRPVTLGNILPSANVATTKVAAYGDPGAMVVGLRKGYMFESSDHHKWNTLQRSFRGHGRYAVKGRAATGFTVLRLTA